ncbi:MAG: hypothetical protein LC781_19330 [Actinobacteria bacterium]|nr:hypothetical protein [Actinomycetota bacterium]
MRYTNLSPPWRKLLLTVHVATAVSVLGTDLVLLVLGISSVRGADPRTIYPAADLIATWLLAPLAVVALGTGVLLGLLTRWGLFRYWWVTIKLTLTAILTGVILFVLVPREEQRRRLSGRLVTEVMNAPDAPDALTGAIERGRALQDEPDLDLLWRSYCQRFSIEHAIRFIKERLGWVRPKVRHPEQADRWTWLILAAYAQLLLARGIVADRRLPWEKPLAVEKLTPYRVLRSFAALLPLLGTPAEAPKPRGRSPGRPKGSLSGPARRYPAIKKAA